VTQDRKADSQKNGLQRCGVGGFTILELVIVVLVVMGIAALAIPNIQGAVSNMRLHSSAGNLAGLFQDARILAAKNNAIYAVRYGTRSGAQIAYIDLNGNGSLDTSEPLVEFSGTTYPASGAPSGAGQPTSYILTGDTGTGSGEDNTRTLAYTPRGLPCDYTNPPTCTTPAATNFVYYLTDRRIGTPGWVAVVVTKSGRTKVVTWNGATWN
jgi:Tfp pilus assembly protein FimT